jgi:RNA polymerase sigma factor (sigma-70 family)
LKPTDNQIESLLEGCIRQDRACQKLLYKKFYSYGMSICLLYTNNQEEAAEILNDGFMKIFSNLKQFDFTKPFKPWLRKIMVNTAINQYHQKQRQIKTEEIDKVYSESDDEMILSGISYQEVVSLLQKLPPSYRTVFNLYAIEGYSHEEVANMLHISVGTSKSNLFKAKEHLKKMLVEFFDTNHVGTR